jgi:multidrug resistance efflux pump
MQQQLAKFTVTAPFSGVIDDVITESKCSHTRNDKLFVLVNLSDMYIEVKFRETYIATINEGTDVG